MQKWLLFIFITFSAFQLNAQQKKRIYFYELDVIKGLFYQPNTIKPYTGIAFDKFPDGKKKMEIPIKNGKITGISKEWAKNGKKISEVQYSNGAPHGRETQWYQIGKKKTQLNYVNGKVDGVVTEWYKDEGKKSEGTFKNGKEEGKHQWWFTNRKLDQVINYENGLAQGLVQNWFESGEIKLETNFKNGLKEGSSIEWFTNGQKFFEGNFREGKEDGKSFVWDRKGMLLKEEKHDFGKLIESKDYQSGRIYSGQGFMEVFNEMNDFFIVKIVGDKVRTRAAGEITYVVDGRLLQMFNQDSKRYFDKRSTTISEKEWLEEYVIQESETISKVTDFKIETKIKEGTTPSGKKYLHWHFVSPSSKAEEQKPRTVQEEHYISFMCGERILSLYGVVTNNDKTEDVVKMLKETADTLEIKEERIDLNALAKSLRDK